MSVAAPRPKKSQAPIFQRRPDLAAAAEAAEAERKEKIRIRREKAAVVTPSADLPAQVEVIAAALVTPLAIFAAGRDSFECIVRADFSKADALAVIFANLPMQENGWSFDATDIQPAGKRDGWPLWRVSRVLP